MGGFSIGVMPGYIVVDGNAALTFQNLIDQQTLFRWGIAGDIIVIVLEALLTVMLFQLFKIYSKTAMLLATYSRLAMAIVMGINLLFYMVPAILMSKPEFLQVFSIEEQEALTLLFFKIHKYGEMAWQCFFAIHLFTLGYVLRKSGKASKWLGILMLLGGVGYAGDCFTQLILSDSAALAIVFSSLLALAVIAEFWFAFWLLFKSKGKESIS